MRKKSLKTETETIVKEEIDNTVNPDVEKSIRKMVIDNILPVIPWIDSAKIAQSIYDQRPNVVTGSRKQNNTDKARRMVKLALENTRAEFEEKFDKNTTSYKAHREILEDEIQNQYSRFEPVLKR